MALPSKEGRELMKSAMLEAYLLQINRMALSNGLIDKDAYIAMQGKIKATPVKSVISRLDTV